MGLLAELIAETEYRPIATFAIPASRLPQSSNGSESSKAVEDSEPKLCRASVRTHLLRLVEREGFDAALVHQLSESELAATAEQIAACDPGEQDDILRAYVHALADTDLRRRGKVPADETAVAHCRHCGPVWVAPEVADAAPKVNGWPRLLGCAWCHVNSGVLQIPRPPVHCRDCRHFEPDAVNPAAGAGICTARVEPLPYPNKARHCTRWTP